MELQSLAPTSIGQNFERNLADRGGIQNYGNTGNPNSNTFYIYTHPSAATSHDNHRRWSSPDRAANCDRRSPERQPRPASRRRRPSTALTAIILVIVAIVIILLVTLPIILTQNARSSREK
jgi:hypothetical protein